MNNEGASEMKKIFGIILTFVLVLSVFSTALAAYTLPEKMERQLQVGSGLRGTLTVRANADAEQYPLIHSIQNAEFEIRGIQYEGNQHYYIYQPGEGESLNALTEICRMDGKYYLRSDLLDEGCLLLPTVDHLINAALKAEGENVSIFPDLLRAVLGTETGNELNTEGLERMIEMWINAFSTDTTVQSSEGSPRLSQTFRIPVEEACTALTEVITMISSSENYMGYFREILSKEQIDLYLNPNLGYYYADAIRQLDMEGEIEFSRTVSTLGDLINSSLILPLDAGRTGYSYVTLQNNEKSKSIFLTGKKGTLYLEIPMETDLIRDDYENAEIRFVKIDNEDQNAKNAALRITASRKSEKTEDTEANKIHEYERYVLHIESNTEGIPEEIDTSAITPYSAADAEITVHYSSKPQLSSPTELEVACNVTHGQYRFSLESRLNTASPWVFTPFSIENARDGYGYTIEDLKNLEKTWMKNAEEKLNRIPESVTTEEKQESGEVYEPEETAAGSSVERSDTKEENNGTPEENNTEESEPSDAEESDESENNNPER